VDAYTDRKLYEIVADEMERGEIAKGSWLKAMTDALGDETLARSLYVKYRVEELESELRHVAAEERRKQPTMIDSIVSAIGDVLTPPRRADGSARGSHKGWAREFEKIRSITDQNKLDDIALYDKHPLKRKEAVKLITSNAIVTHVSKKDPDRTVREAALNRLTELRNLKS